MKKIILSIAIAMMAGGMLTSCDKNKEHCWTITYKISGATATETYWGTAEQCDLEIEREKAEKASEANISVKEIRATRKINKQHKSKVDCDNSPINSLS